MDRCLLIADSLESAQPLVECVHEAGPRVALDCIDPPALSLLSEPRSYLLYLVHLARRPGDSLELLHRLLLDHRAAAVCIALPRTEVQLRQSCLTGGAIELLDLPLEPYPCVSRLQHLFQLTRQTRLLQRMSEQIRRRREAAWSDALQLESELLRRLTRVSAHNDAITHKHQQRTAQLAGRIARRMGLAGQEAAAIEQATYLHDIGKIGIPTQVLCKVGRFNARDRQIMSRHPLIGHELLRDGKTPALQLGATIALSHHERFDGSGYPYGRTGPETALAARIASVADVFDSITEQRRYNRTRSVQHAVEQLESQARGGNLDPACVRALRDLVEEGQV